MGVLGITRDITNNKKAEQTLKESEEKYRSVVERANDGIVIIQDMIIKYINPRAFDLPGYDPTEMTGALMTNYVHPDELLKAVEYYKRRIAGEDVPRVYESAFVHKEGRKIDVELAEVSLHTREKPRIWLWSMMSLSRKKQKKI